MLRRRSWACSERTERQHVPGLHRHGNDVSIYTCALGALLSGSDDPLGVKPEYAEEWGWLTPYLEAGQRERCAVLMLSTTMMAGSAASRENLYYQRQRRAYREQWERLFAATVAKLEAMPVRLLSYYAGDVMDWLPQVPKDGAVVSFPPFYAGGYENLYKPLDAVFEWPGRPSYEVMDEAAVDRFFDLATSRRHWMLALHRERADMAEHLRGMTKTSNRGVPVYVYASEAKARVVMPQQQVKHCLLPLVADSIGETPRIIELPAAQFNELRSLYLNPGIAPAMVTQAYGLLVDDVLVGVWAISPPDSVMGNFTPELHPHAYLMSDFAVGDGSVKRLSALVLRAALSREAQLLYERCLHRRCRGLVTTAFSDKPVSMKYRGLFDLHSRRQDADGKYVLNYKARVGELTSVPFAFLEDGRYTVLSGNHRVRAAIDAGLESIECMVTDQPLSRSQQVAIQLSHNSLAGEDNLSVLKQLYEEIEDIDLRAYAGLDDKTLELLDEVKVPAMSEASLEYQVVPLIFLPPEVERVRDAFERARKLVSEDEAWLARFEDYDALLDGLAAASSAYAVSNVATGLAVVLGVFERHIEDLAEGWYDDEGDQPLHKKWVPLASVFGTYDIPAEAAQVVRKAVLRMRDKGEVASKSLWQAVEFWASDYLSGTSDE